MVMLCSTKKKQTTFQCNKKIKISRVCLWKGISYLWNKFFILYKRDNNSTFSSYLWSCLRNETWQLWGTVIAKVIFVFSCPRVEYSQYTWNRYLLWYTYRSPLSMFQSHCSSQMCQTEADFSWFWFPDEKVNILFLFCVSSQKCGVLSLTRPGKSVNCT